MTLIKPILTRNDIAGFQNRLGLFFFTLALFGFSCLSSLGLFANERILFMRERCVKVLLSARLAFNAPIQCKRLLLDFHLLLLEGTAVLHPYFTSFSAPASDTL